MSDEFGNWQELAKLWHTESRLVSAVEVERHALRQRRQMVALAGAEAGALALAFIAAVWIAMHTAFVAMSAITLVFVGVCGYLQHRLRREPPPAGDDDLLTSLDARMAHEDWVLTQLGVGRAVSLVTLVSMALLGSDHLRFFTTTPAERLWALLAITLVVVAILAWNLVLTWQAKRRRARLGDYSRHIRA
jgi:hypothetical protein